MEEYPRTVAELECSFGTEAACREYLHRLRFPEGFRCPRCQGRTAWTTQRNLLVCAACQYQLSLTAGTIFQDTRKPLTMWFRAIWWVTAQKNGASALGLQQVLGLGSYATAWTWLHKLRRAMVRPNREQLHGRVERGERPRPRLWLSLPARRTREESGGFGCARSRIPPWVLYEGSS